MTKTTDRIIAEVRAALAHADLYGGEAERRATLRAALERAARDLTRAPRERRPSPQGEERLWRERRTR